MEIGARRGAAFRFVILRFAAGRWGLPVDLVWAAVVRRRAGRAFRVAALLAVDFFELADVFFALTFMNAVFAPWGAPKLSSAEFRAEHRVTQREISPDVSESHLPAAQVRCLLGSALTA